MSDSKVTESWETLPKQRRRVVTKQPKERFIIPAAVAILALIALAISPFLAGALLVFALMLPVKGHRGFVYQRIILKLRSWWIRFVNDGKHHSTPPLSAPNARPRPFSLTESFVGVHGYGGGMLGFVEPEDEREDIFFLTMRQNRPISYMDDSDRTVWNADFVSMQRALSEHGVKKSALLSMQCPGNSAVLTRYVSKRIPATPQGSYLYDLAVDYEGVQQQIVEDAGRNIIQLLVLHVPRSLAWGKTRRPSKLTVDEYNRAPIKQIFNMLRDHGQRLGFDVEETPPLELTVLLKLGLNPADAEHIYDLYEHAIDDVPLLSTSLVNGGPWPGTVNVSKKWSQADHSFNSVWRIKAYPKHRIISPDFFDVMLVLAADDAWFTHTQLVEMVPSDKYERRSYNRKRWRKGNNSEKAFVKTSEEEAEADADEDYDEISRSGGELAAFAQLIKVSARDLESLELANERLQSFLKYRGIIIEQLDGDAEQVPLLLAAGLGVTSGL